MFKRVHSFTLKFTPKDGRLSIPIINGINRELRVIRKKPKSFPRIKSLLETGYENVILSVPLSFFNRL